MLKQFAAMVLCGLCALLGGAGAQLFIWASRQAEAHSPPLPPAQQVSVETDKVPALAIGDRFQSIVKKVSPAVVSVDAVKPPNLAGKAKEESGSGVLVRIPGVSGVIVVTNNHVVGEASRDKVYITLSDGTILQPTRVVADPESDISLLQLAGDLPTAELGDSDRVGRGQYVLAFGSPFGLNQTVTHGIISATDRGQISLGSTIRIKEFIQTDAAINPGSSGGPLVDLDGKVVGINTAIASQSGNNTGVSFSIPANLVKRVASQLFEKGKVTRGYLGVQLATTIEPAEALRLGLKRVCGGLVEIVHPGTPAEAAGLKPGDVILKLEDVDLRDENHLINLVSALPPHQRVRLQVWRNRQPQVIDVAIGDWWATRTKR
ncbi:MAG TPA: trypsin-like peptidase domain-containing protein [Gemmataceae bacterium]